MRIAFVRQRYTSSGGAERFIERAAAALARLGAEVSVIARAWPEQPGVRIVRVDPPHLGGLWRDLGFARAARAAWRAGGYDLVQCHERIPGCDLYRAGDGVHRQWLEHRLAAASILERLRLRFDPRHLYLCAAERALFRHPALRAVICNSRMVQAEIARRFGLPEERLPIVHNGVDLDRFRPARIERTGPFVFLFVGSGFARKGLAHALAALARVPEARLVVAGGDRRLRRYEALARRLGLAARVRFLGAVTDPLPLYGEADCFILPSLYDPFPNAALEALACGLPVIVSERCGTAEILREGESGWICRAGDATDLARALRQALARARAPELRRGARAAAEPYSLEAMAGRLVKLYERLCGTPVR